MHLVSVPSRTLRRTAAAVAVLVLTGVVGIASGVASPRSGYAPGSERFTYEASFTTQHAGKPTGFKQAIDYVNPRDHDAKPPAIMGVHVVLPEGSRIDPTVPRVCRASDAELMLAGPAACPAKSRVGEGTLSADTGAPGEVGTFPRTIETDARFFNGGGDLIFLAETTNTLLPLRISSRFEVGERSFTSTVPPLPGAPPPDPFLAIDEVTNSLFRIASDAGDGYITTPSRCPRDRLWRFTAEVTYRDGVVQKQDSLMRCRGSSGVKRRPGGVYSS